MKNQSNFTTLDEALLFYGYTWTLDGLWKYGMTSISCFGLAFNLLGMKVLGNEEFHTPLFKCLKVRLLTSTVITLFCAFSLISNAQLTYDWMNSRQAFSAFVYFIQPVINTGYYFGTVSSIQFSLFRISNFVPRFKVHLNRSQYLISLGGLVLCIITNFPYYFFFVPDYKSVYIGNSTNPTNIWFINTRSVFDTTGGKALASIVNLFRDALTLVVDIILMGIAAYYNNLFKVNKQKLVSRVAPAAITSSSDSESSRVKRTERRLTLVSLCLCCMNTVMHFANLTLVVYRLSPEKTPDLPFYENVILFIAILTISIRHSIQFFLMYTFNIKFRQLVHEFFKLNRT